MTTQTHSIVTGGYISNDNRLIVTYGYSGRASPIFDRVIAAMEKKNVSTSWINSKWVKDGLADHTLFDEIIERVES
jgi:hypothetical protein